MQTILKRSFPSNCEYSMLGELRKHSRRSVNIGNPLGVQADWARDPKRVQRQQAEQDEPWADGQRMEGTQRGGGHRRERETNREKNRRHAWSKGTLARGNPNAPSDSDRVPSARRTTKRTVGRQSEKKRTAVDSSVPQHDRGIDPRRCCLVGQTSHPDTLIQLLGRVVIRDSDLRRGNAPRSGV